MNYSVICADMKTNDNSSLNDDTVASYVKALKKIFVVEAMGQKKALKAPARLSGGFLVYSPNAARISSYRSISSSPVILNDSIFAF